MEDNKPQLSQEPFTINPPDVPQTPSQIAEKPNRKLIKYFSIVIAVIFVLIAIPVATMYISGNKNPTPSNGGQNGQTACTMEAKLCPDGSYVGRTGPNCEFAPCPTPISSKSATPINYTCPSPGYINCQPVGTIEGEITVSDSCKTDYVNWVKANCPGVNFAY